MYSIIKYIPSLSIGFCFILTLLGFQACKDGPNDLRQKKVDSLAFSLMQLEDKLNIDTEDLGSEKRKMEKIYKLIKMKDTGITLEMGIVLEQYLNEIRIFNGVIEHKGELQKELEELKIQLRNLNHSLKEDKMSEADFKKAFATEKADIEHLEEMIEEKIDPYLKVQAEHVRIAPKIEEYATKFADEKKNNSH